MSPNVLALLPELILTLVGVLVMLVEPCLKPGSSRKPLGWLAIVGTVAALAGSWYQIQFGTLHAFSGTIQVDAFSVLFHFVIGSVVLVTLLGSIDFFEGNASHAGEYFALILFGAVGMMLMTCSVELLMVFVGLEISSISTYIMCGFRKGQATGTESSIKYFLLGSFATAFFLYGVALSFGATGSTNIYAIAHGLETTATPALAFTALALILIGLGFKVSAAPFHVWTPDVYQGAPAPVVGLMSTAPKAAAFAVLLRITFTGFPTYQHRWAILMWVLAALSMTVGNLGALMQRDVKRMLAYSSIAHAGYLMVAFTAFPFDGIAAACFYTATYAAMNVGAFAVVTQIAGYDERARSIDDFTGLGQKRPYLAALLSFFLLSLIGIPFTGGFFGKFYVFSAAIHGGNVWLAVIGLLNSGVACFYYLRLLAAIYTRPGSESTRLNQLRRISVPAAIGIGLAAVATGALGIVPSGAVSFAEYASHSTLIEQGRQECAASPDSCHLQLQFDEK
ncbi:NADH-quinone oxidoreductase subunit N [Tunturibacter empetritectus]|uniref:NADH-quinone oxidoreductase subunit N n=1 Tax=Tunturiibacter empetritectus TaxID=3069691 RepID=A0A7W8IHE9_9BACT|nr:NADH-quinone oxidoreductase subunit N [Edaphobacter lichenicola]MBB5316298.1 NADH-quinone oxidoreductase subunit N [Edaphobacter lichenicola]